MYRSGMEVRTASGVLLGWLKHTAFLWPNDRVRFALYDDTSYPLQVTSDEPIEAELVELCMRRFALSCSPAVERTVWVAERRWVERLVPYGFQPVTNLSEIE